MTSIQITQNAWRKMSNIIKLSKNKYGFIYSASSGGCNGFNFELNLLNQKLYESIRKQKYLTVLNHKDTHLYVDPLSEMYLLGTTIDYMKEDYTQKIYENKFIYKVDKELMTSCGCGVSFSPKHI